ncbi:MAG TPA: hypothetical protein VG013_21885 [Gemmataceae bacterium]|nr:hypothetical protein [Gemmataceae bacterium]
MPDPHEPVAADEATDPTVYVSRRGTAYHKEARCPTLLRRPRDVKAIRLTEARAQARKPCRQCRPPG